MRLLRAKLNWGLGPQTPRIYRFFPARMEVFEFIQGTGPTCPPPFRPLSRSLGLLPSMALSSPAQVLPEWTTSTSSCNTFSANGDYPLNFVSHSRGSLQKRHPIPLFPWLAGRPQRRQCRECKKSIVSADTSALRSFAPAISMMKTAEPGAGIHPRTWRGLTFHWPSIRRVLVEGIVNPVVVI